MKHSILLDRISSENLFFLFHSSFSESVESVKFCKSVAKKVHVCTWDVKRLAYLAQ